MSHTQLQMTDRSPHIAAILNITPNHLDQFSWDEYVALKQNIARYQTAEDIVVLNLDDPTTMRTAAGTGAQRWFFSMQEQLPGQGAYLDLSPEVEYDTESTGEWHYYVYLQRSGQMGRVIDSVDIPLRGNHNIENVLAATAIAAAAGVHRDDIAQAILKFKPVPHRLEEVAEIDGAVWVNDSIATTPERTLAGIRSFKEPIVLLLGGRDKDLPKDELAHEALRRCTGIVFFGESGALFEAAFAANAGFAPEPPQTSRVNTLEEAVAVAREMAGDGDVVLLSPACTSFDAYPNFEARGEEFRRLVQSMLEGGR
jgi:UDP-N-acetylmuramoylalanine--D-glutamate ligase